jgi:hypothetical protein
MMRARLYDTSRVTTYFCRAALLLLLAGASSLAYAVDFKGIELGKTLWASTERIVFGGLDCNPLKLGDEDYQNYVIEMQALVPGVQQVCVATTTIATVPADVTVLLGLSRRVLRLTFQFEEKNYPLVLKAMSEKWGEGVHEVRGEADESMWWDFSDGTTVAVHHTPVETEGLDGVVYEGLAEYALSDTTPAGDL